MAMLCSSTTGVNLPGESLIVWGNLRFIADLWDLPPTLTKLDLAGELIIADNCVAKFYHRNSTYPQRTTR